MEAQWIHEGTGDSASLGPVRGWVRGRNAGVQAGGYSRFQSSRPRHGSDAALLPYQHHRPGLDGRLRQVVSAPQVRRRVCGLPRMESFRAVVYHDEKLNQ